jgi:preprotein translocase subunit YajC
MSTPSILAMTLAAAGAEPSGFTAFFVQMFPLLMIAVIFWFLIFRPQMKRAKEHQANIASVKKGDEVITGGGLRGRATKVTDDEVEVELAQGVRVRAVKSTLTQVVKPAAKPAND